MNFGDMKESVRLKVDDLKKSRFTDKQIRLAINEAYSHVYRELIKQNTFTDVRSATVDFTSGNQEVAFDLSIALNFQKVIHVQDSNSNPIPIYSEALSKRSDVRSVYLKRTTFGTVQEILKIGWYICPNSNFTLTIEYLPKFIGFSTHSEDTNTLETVPQEHHDVVVLRATLLLLASDEDRAQIWFAIYNDALTSMKESIELSNDEVDTVVDLQTEYYHARNRG